MSIIRIENLTRDYGQNRGVFNLSFEIEKGEVFGFLGPNGAGKTTAIRHLMGFLQPQVGVCAISGLDCWKDSSVIQKTLGYIPGEIAFFDDMRGSDFLKFIAKYRGDKVNGRKNELIEMFDLDPNHKIKKMSKGTKQKLGIVAAFMHNPDVLILDEPTSGLDPLMQNRFVELILKEKTMGKTIIMSSHIFEEIEKTCDRIGIIKEGRLVAINSVDKLKESRIKKFAISLSTEIEAVKFAQDVGSSEVNSNNVIVNVQDNFQDLIYSMSKYNVTNISEMSQTLEEVFMHYYRGDDND